MADDERAVTPAPGSTLYTGAGLHPFQPGEVASAPAAHAGELVEQGVVECVPPPAPARLE